MYWWIWFDNSNDYFELLKIQWRSTKGQLSSTTTITQHHTNHVLWTRSQLSTFLQQLNVFFFCSAALSLSLAIIQSTIRVQQQLQPNKPSRKEQHPKYSFIHSFGLVVDDIVLTDLVQLLTLPRVGRYSFVPQSSAPCELLHTHCSCCAHSVVVTGSELKND
jgi:hypothetical protein